MNAAAFDLNSFEFQMICVVRLLLASVCGFAIGIERTNRLKDAGMRTHLIVCMASALMMIVSKYGFFDIAGYAEFFKVDASRVAANIVSGVSFLGAGIIFVRNRSITGLTTSAGLVSCCILGFAMGAGLYTLTLIVHVFLLCILAGFPSFETYLKDRSNHFEIHMELKNSSYLRDFVTVSRRLGLRIDDIEANQAYAGSGLSVYSVSVTICSAELKKYKTHVEIIEALSSLDYIYHIEEMH